MSNSVLAIQAATFGGCVARFAPVVPIPIAEQLQNAERDLLGSYHLLLAHDIIDKPVSYQRIYGRTRQEYPGTSFIIMDNSIVELGKAMEIKDLIAASEILEPDCIVIPDVMGDAEGTRASAIRFTREYYQAAYKKGGHDSHVTPLMGVLQGETVEEVLETFSTFYALPLVDFIGIPRVLTKQQGSRMPVLMALQKSAALQSFQGFHLLGFSDNILDDVACARVPFIGGIDSAVPTRAGLAGSKMDLNDWDWSNKLGPRGNFWETPIDSTWKEMFPAVKHNLDSYRKLIRT